MDINSIVLGNNLKIKKFIDVLNKKEGGDVWLIQGKKGIGKAKLVNYLSSQKLNLEDYQGQDIINPDFFIINQMDEKKKIIPVEQVRKTGKFFSTTSNNNHKILVIDSISELNHFGHNSLLKILENLPLHSFVFLLDHMTNILPATIKSRCKIINLQPLKDNEVYNIINKKFKTEDKKLLRFYSELASGSAGEALDLYELNIKKLFDILCDYIINIANTSIFIIDIYIKDIKENNKLTFSNIFFKIFILILLKSIKLKSNLMPTFLNDKENNAVKKLCKEASYENIFMVLEYAQNLNSDINNYNLDIKNGIYSTLIKLKKIF